MGTVPLTGPEMKHPTHAVFLILLVISSCQAKFFDLQEDGSIECETKADCPDDVLKANNTVLEFRCLPRVDVDNEESGESSGEETFIEHDEEILNQLICGEENSGYLLHNVC